MVSQQWKYTTVKINSVQAPKSQLKTGVDGGTCSFYLHCSEKSLSKIGRNILHTLYWKKKKHSKRLASNVLLLVHEVPSFLTDGHQEILQGSRHLTLDALLQSLLTHVLVLHQSCKNMAEESKPARCC